MSRLPRLARLLLALTRVPRDERADVESDLIELYLDRRRARGRIAAWWRLCHDVVSLWRGTGAASGRAPVRRPRLALVRDAVADVRYAGRLFARQPGVMLLAVGGLALGLGIATAAFTIMSAALSGEGIADAPRAPGILRAQGRSVSTSWPYTEFLALRASATRLRVEAVATDTADVRVTPAAADGAPASIAFVSGGFFPAAGARMALGRSLAPGDEAVAGAPPVVISHVFWASAFNRDPAVVGRTIRVGRTDAIVVGVARRGFTAPSSRMLWMPAAAYGAVYSEAPGPRTPEMVEVFGRLLPDASLAEAGAQINAVAAGLPRTGSEPVQARLDSQSGLGRLPTADALSVSIAVFGVIALVVVLACANVATMLVSTAITREREMGVRAALGASRARIVRQLVTESLALGIVAALLALASAAAALPAIAAFIEAPAGADLAPHRGVYVFLAVLTLVAGVAAGLAPALHGRGVDLVGPLKGAASNLGRVGPRRLRSALVVTQAAMSVVLIVIAAFFVRASARAAAIDAGFNPDGLYAVSAATGDAGAGVEGAFWARAVADVQSLPGVQAVTLAEITPFSGVTNTSLTREPVRRVGLNRVQAGYFEVMGLRMLAGRGFTRDEVGAAAPVAIVSQSLAHTFWPDGAALGQMLPREIPLPPPMTADAARPEHVRPVVVGIVADALTSRLREQNAYAIYQPLGPSYESFASMLIRVAPESAGAMSQAGQRLRAIDPAARIEIASVAQRLDAEVAQPRTLAAISGLVGVIAIFLSTIGLYGLTASVTSQRSAEMSVRVALGADRRALLQLLMAEGLRPVVIGLVLGAAAAFAIGRVLAGGLFFGVGAGDPASFAAAAALLLAASALAVFVPTRRAAAVDPALVLKRT